MFPNIHSWHSPRNEACDQNRHPDLSCSCKRQVKRKPFRVVRVNDPEAMKAHDIISEIHPNGLLVLRRKGRRKRVSITLGVLYERLELNEAIKAIRAVNAMKKAARRAK